MTIIDEILAVKAKEIKKLPVFDVQHLKKNDISFFEALMRGKEKKINVIAEVKKASPTLGKIKNVDVVEQAQKYGKYGAVAVSCLTDSTFFGGNCEDLKCVSGAVRLPVIRKDFIYTQNQIGQARFFGAASFLLMVDVMEKTGADLKQLIDFGRSLGMEPLVETYDERSIAKAVDAGAKIVGVNSRNFLKAGLPIEKDRFARLLPLIPAGIVRVAESGMKTIDDVMAVNELADCVLIGSALMQKNDRELAEFFDALKQ